MDNGRYCTMMQMYFGFFFSKTPHTKLAFMWFHNTVKSFAPSRENRSKFFSENSFEKSFFFEFEKYSNFCTIITYWNLSLQRDKTNLVQLMETWNILKHFAAFFPWWSLYSIMLALIFFISRIFYDICTSKIWYPEINLFEFIKW